MLTLGYSGGGGGARLNAYESGGSVFVKFGGAAEGYISYRIDGGAWVHPGLVSFPYAVPTATDATDVEAYGGALATYLAPDPLAVYRSPDGTDPVVVIDRSRGFYYWDGSEREFADLTEVAGKGHYLDALTGIDFSAFVQVTEWTMPATGYTGGTQTVAGFGKTTDGGQRFNTNLSTTPRASLSTDTPLAAYANVQTSQTTLPNPWLHTGRGRWVHYAANGATYWVAEQGETDANTTSTAIYDTITPNRLSIGYRQIAGTQDQVFIAPETVTTVIYNGTFTEAERKAIAKKSFDGLAPIHVLGDSIWNEDTYANRGGLSNRIRALAAARGHVPWSTSIVGGTNLEQFYTRYLATPDHYGSNLIIGEGGLDTSGVDTLGAVQDIVGLHTGEDWVIVEPIVSSEKTAGSAARIEHDAAFDAIVAWAGEGRIIRTHDSMIAANDGSANDLTDVANDVCPRSLRTDGIHPNSAGKDVLAGVIYSALLARGWL